VAAIRWDFAVDVEADPAVVFAWLTDYGEDDHARPAFFRGAGTPPKRQRAARRTVVARVGDTVEIEDSWGRRRFRAKVTLAPARNELRIEGDFGYDATWSARPSLNGTRLEVRGTVAPGGLAGALMRLARKSFLRQMEADFNGHVEDLRESVGRPPARIQ